MNTPLSGALKSVSRYKCSPQFHSYSLLKARLTLSKHPFRHTRFTARTISGEEGVTWSFEDIAIAICTTSVEMSMLTVRSAVIAALNVRATMARAEEIQLAKTPKTWRSADLAWLTAKRWYLINPEAKFKKQSASLGALSEGHFRECAVLGAPALVGPPPPAPI